MPKILVTGATGFVGTHLTKALVDLGHDVVALTSGMGNIALATTWATIPATDIVIHLAAKTYVPDSWEQPQIFMETNAYGTLRALEYCRKHKAKMIFISSYLYGNPANLPIDESSPIFTPNPYALSKKIAEDFCTFYADNYHLSTVIIRPFNIYGPGQPTSFLIPMLIKQVLTNKEIKVKDLEPKRDYIYIADLVNAIIKALQLTNFNIINIGSGTSYSVAEIIGLIQEICGTDYQVFSSGTKRPAEIMDTVAGIIKAAEILHWQPIVSMKAGLLQIVQLEKNSKVF